MHDDDEITNLNRQDRMEKSVIQGRSAGRRIIKIEGRKKVAKSVVVRVTRDEQGAGAHQLMEAAINNSGVIYHLLARSESSED